MHPKERVNSVGPGDWAGERRLEMKSTKVPTKSRHGFFVMTVNKGISSGDEFSLAREDEVVSIGTDDELDGKVAGAALRTHQGAAAAWDGPAAGTKMLS